MQLRRLGRTDLSIAPLVLGGNVFGWTADKKASFAVLDRFAAAGLNAIDTADVYSAWVPGNSGGESETIIGEWMKARGNRSRIIVVTKVGSPMGPGKEGLKAAYIEEAVEASLRRLQTDAIDLYLSHWPDMATPFDETLGAYQRLIEKGKIRWCGASNLNVALLEAALAAAKAQRRPALRSPAAGIQSRRPSRVRIRPRRALRARGDRRRHLFQPRQGLPLGQIPQRRGPRQQRARGRGQGLSQSARISHPRRAREGRREPQGQAGGSRARLGHGEARRHRADRKRHLGRAGRQPRPRDRAQAHAGRHGGARHGERALSARHRPVGRRR